MKTKSLLAAAVVVVAVLLAGQAFYAEGEITVESYTVSGRGVSVVLYNSGSATYSGAEALATIAGGSNQWGQSFVSYIPANSTVTVNIYYTNTVTGVIEGPDPIGP